jgi:hypothetical protein
MNRDASGGVVDRRTIRRWRIACRIESRARGLNKEVSFKNDLSIHFCGAVPGNRFCLEWPIGRDSQGDDGQEEVNTV